MHESSSYSYYAAQVQCTQNYTIERTGEFFFFRLGGEIAVSSLMKTNENDEPKIMMLK